jgi:hypothetical protein
MVTLTIMGPSTSPVPRSCPLAHARVHDEDLRHRQTVWRHLVGRASVLARPTKSLVRAGESLGVDIGGLANGWTRALETGVQTAFAKMSIMHARAAIPVAASRATEPFKSDWRSKRPSRGQTVRYRPTSRSREAD